MPSFLSKVFGRKKADDKETPGLRASNGSLLDGKFEAVSPTVSPTADKFTTELPGVNGRASADKEKEKDKAPAFSLLRSKSGIAANSVRSEAPHLSLNLPGPKDDAGTRHVRSVFEADPDERILLTESVIGEKRLNPLETLILVRACSQAITGHGLETLGIMHPHWYSASPDVQRRLISLFIQSLAPKSPITTLAPSPSSAVSAFESEISSTRSPHDVAAVLRWGLRHLQLEGSSFGKDDKWYSTFLEGERSSEYAVTAFSDKLVPEIPPAHLELLSATLNLFSSLAAHAEANGISGSKLSKVLGLWLLTTVRSEPTEGWSSFYSRWETSGRQLEHLFLSLIRDEASKQRLPKRLTELVSHYPYAKGPKLTQEPLLPRPRFSTRQYTALFIGIETELPASGAKPIYHPLKLISDAFKSTPPSAPVPPTEAVKEGEDEPAETAKPTSDADLWEKVKKAASESAEASPTGYSGLSRVFADETIRFLSLVPVDTADKEPLVPTFTLLEGSGHRRSFSLGDVQGSGTSTPANGAANGKPSGSTAAAAIPASSSTPAPAATPTSKDAAPNSGNAIGLDWAQFSTSGFLESIPAGAPLAATLLDKDVEVTTPARRGSKKNPPASANRGRKSLDILPPINTSGGSRRSKPKKETSTAQIEEGTEKLVSYSTNVSVTQLDEAFVDFWSDALLDPISKDWPPFIICKLKSGLQGLDVPITGEGGEHVGGVRKKVEWLIIEQKFVTKRPTPAPTPVEAPTPSTSKPSSPAEDASSKRPRPSSPKPSFRSDISATLGATRKRFTFFGGKDKVPSSPASEISTASELSSATTSKAKKKTGKSVKVGEMGEILKEEDEDKKSPELPKEEEKKDKEQEKKEGGITSGASDPVAAAAISAAVGALAGGAVAAGVLSDDDEKAVSEEPVAAEPASEPASVEAPSAEPIAEPAADPSPAEAAAPVEAEVVEPSVAEPTSAEPTIEAVEPIHVLASIPPSAPEAPTEPEAPAEPEVIAEPVVSAEPESLPEPVVEEPIVEQIPEPVIEQAPAPASEPSPEPVEEILAEPAPEPIGATIAQPTAIEEPVIEEASAPVAEPTSEPVEEIVVQPTAIEEPVIEEASAPVAEPTPELLEEIVMQPPAIEEPVIEEASAPVAEPTPEFVEEIIAQPVAVDEPTREESPAPIAEPTPEPAEEIAQPTVLEEPVEALAPAAEPAPEPEIHAQLGAVQEPVVETPAPFEEPLAVEAESVPAELEVEPPVTLEAAPEPIVESPPAVPESELLVKETSAAVAPVVEEAPLEPEPVEQAAPAAPPQLIEEHTPAVAEAESESVVHATDLEPSELAPEPQSLPEPAEELVDEPEPAVQALAPASEPVVAEPEPVAVAEPVIEELVVEAVAVPESVQEPTPEPVEELVAEAAPESFETLPADLTSHGAPDAVLEPSPIVDIPTPAPIDETVTGSIEPIHDPSPKPTDESVDLPPVPVVESHPVLVEATPLPEETTPEIESAPEPASDISLPSVEHANGSLPPAPETVVLSGATPGPEVALSSSEPEAVLHASAVPTEETTPLKAADDASHPAQPVQDE